MAAFFEFNRIWERAAHSPIVEAPAQERATSCSRAGRRSGRSVSRTHGSARFAPAVLAVLLSPLALIAQLVTAPAEIAVTTPARPGSVSGTDENSDAFIWRLMTNQIAAPVTMGSPTPAQFETWASDGDTFSLTPHWPGSSAAHVFHASVLGHIRRGLSSWDDGAIDVGCAVPPNPFVGGFPIAGSPARCIAEEVKRNRPQYDYLVGNNLNTQAGLISAFASSFKVDMPKSAISVKGDWIPVSTLIKWIPQLHDRATVETLYLTTIAQATEYALVSLHVSSKQNAAWVWGTFEHSLTPGRCDVIGCFDSFGAVTRSVPPNMQTSNTQYGACPKTSALRAMMRKAGLSQVWDNYCLKGTEVDYTNADGTPYVLGNSVIEGINANGAVAASSCISCHAYASFGAKGVPTGPAVTMLGYNATGRPIPDVFALARRFDFTWGVFAAPPPTP